MTKKITVDELKSMVEDPDVPEEALDEYVVLDTDASDAFAPAFRPNPDLVEGVTAQEGDWLLARFNAGSRRKRHRRYREKLAGGWEGIRVVSEGDSWFQYPIKLRDVIDQLSDDYAIFSLGAAGDLLADMIEIDELSGAIEAEHPQLVLISGGGNDMVGNGRLATMLKPGESHPPLEATNSLFEVFLNEIEQFYVDLFERLIPKYDGLKFIVHGYDRAIPADGKWLGRPMKSIRIESPNYQRQVVAHLIDRFNERLERIQDRFSGVVFHADCRGVVEDDKWYDELHPTDEGYSRAADTFRAAIDRALSS